MNIYGRQCKSWKAALKRAESSYSQENVTVINGKQSQSRPMQIDRQQTRLLPPAKNASAFSFHAVKVLRLESALSWRVESVFSKVRMSSNKGKSVRASEMWARRSRQPVMKRNSNCNHNRNPSLLLSSGIRLNEWETNRKKPWNEMELPSYFN